MTSPALTRRRAALPLLFVVGVSHACGFMFSKGPPVGHEQMNYFSCTETDVGPVLDIVWGGLNLLGAIMIASDPDAYEETYGTDASSAIVLGFAWGGVSTIAAVTGFNRSEQCRDAKLQLAQRQAQYRAAAAPPAVAATPTPAPVTQVVQAVVLSPPSDTLMVGATLQLVATAYHSSGVTIPDRAFTWSSSNDAIASVSNAGLVTAYAPGSVVIAANTGNVVGIARLTIFAAPEQ